MTDPRSSPGEEEIDCMSVIFEDTVDLEERLINTIQLTGRLITYEEPLESVVKEVLRLFWNGLGVVGIICVKPNIYSITVGEDQVASRILEGNPCTWHTHEPLHYEKNAHCLSEKQGAVIKVEDPSVDLRARRISPVSSMFFPPTTISKEMPETNERHWRRKWDSNGVFYYLPDKAWEASARLFTAKRKAQEEHRRVGNVSTQDNLFHIPHPTTPAYPDNGW
ncbi:hypothetical protein ACFX2I_022173 [Malus domestica]|uniref:Uncharacterized protein n=1 Tax=Malus domestica TaxID=3750 RepID=A0A498HMR9_MALDO|nr:hypothetical protein DVH24_013443 [Malus domestica]